MIVTYEREGRNAVITINRPEARNAVNGEVAAGIEAAIDRLEADDEAWTGILTGAGTVFSAGADLKEVASGGGRNLGTERGGFGGIVVRDRTKPIIAAVDGPAVAGGCEIALACDLIVASTNARFGLPEVKRSLVAGAGGLQRLPRALPFNLAMELALTGDTIDAEQAHTHGMVNVVCAPGEALAAAAALADRVNANAPLAVRETRNLVRSGATQDTVDAIGSATRAMAALAATDDWAEGPRAFIEKRPPVWTGR
ncbi:MAG: crotonase/enoyl-CoA hydratase family protein [Acidimicrobiia bacterium]|nr:crotonase/enoyl-CoA hydratase family protein [Acidimicrobiia bacterium]